MKYAKKLNLLISPSDFKKSGKVICRHAFTKDAPQGRLVRKYAPKNQIEMLEQAIPEKIKQHLLTVNYSEIHLLKAHVHVTDECVINFYQNTWGEVTTFWEGPIEPDDSYTSDNGNNYLNLQHNNLEVCESFIAEDGDVWLLNTKQLHSVSKPYEEKPRARHFSVDANDKPRYVVQAYFNAPFEFISGVLAEENLIVENIVQEKKYG